MLLVTGGCCHDYGFQTAAMKKFAADQKLNIEWKVFHDGGNGTAAQIALYDKPDWASGYDVVVHNECFASTTDPDYIRRITAAHKAGANAVVIHCAMHTYRDARIDDWREFLGVTSRRHDHQAHYPVKVEKTDHPIMRGFPKDYKSAMDELYIIEKLWPNAKVLATSPSERDGKLHPVFWTNQYGKARVFGTTYGHSNATFQDKVFLTTLMRGIRWAAGRLPETDQRTGARNNARARNRLAGLKVVKDIPYVNNTNPRQALDLALPPSKSDKPLPVIAFIHGGAWRAGKKDGGLNRIADLVRSRKYAGISIGYRLSDEAKWPAQIHDCKAAIRWIRGNAKKYNLDPNRIAVYGTSAGGHLVAMLGVSGGVKELEGTLGSHTNQSSRVTAVANYFGPSNLLTMGDFPSKMDHNAANSPESLLIGGAIQENKEKANAASPLNYVTSDDAPMLLVHGDADPLVPFNQSEILDAALDRAGVHSVLLKVEGGGHGGFRNAQISQRLSRFLAYYLLQQGSASADGTEPNEFFEDSTP